MKSSFTTPILLTLATTAMCAFSQDAVTTTPNTGVPTASLRVRKQMTDEKRLNWLQANGQVPQDAEMKDWVLAEKTSWWGKQLDPKGFWKGRVLWLDGSAVSDARRHGRGYPPIPYENPSLPHYQDDGDVLLRTGEVEGYEPHVRTTSKENAFWQDFIKHHPDPPGDIEKSQLWSATRVLKLRHDLNKHNPKSHLTKQTVLHVEEVERREALKAGLPAEAFTDDALFWSYVLRARKDSNTLIDLYVDPKYITSPLTEDETKEANAWKITYLNRLQAEKTDQSYINAYLKAWNLPASALSSQHKK